MAQGRTHSFNGNINIASSTFGDIAVYRGKHSKYGWYTGMFVTGLSQAQVYAFVLRFRFYDNGTFDSKIIAGSSASSAGTLNGYRGIAVNSSGKVATVLPFQSGAGSVDRLIMFNADFDETGSGRPLIMLNGLMMGGQGMCSDSAGNFYIATGKLGINGKSGALAVVNPTGSALLKIITIGNSMMIDSADVAVSADRKYAYVTIFQGGLVVRAQLK